MLTLSKTYAVKTIHPRKEYRTDEQGTRNLEVKNIQNPMLSIQYSIAIDLNFAAYKDTSFERPFTYGFLKLHQ
jgi:hypothetical protein